jgi:hypothetical protein
MQLHANEDVGIDRIEQKSRDDVSMAFRSACNIIRLAERHYEPVEDPQAAYDDFIKNVEDRKGVWEFINIKMLLRWKEYVVSNRTQIKILPDQYDSEYDAINRMWKECALLFPKCFSFDQVCCSIFEYSVPHDENRQIIYRMAKACKRCGQNIKHSPAKCTKTEIYCLGRNVEFNISCSECGLLTHTTERCTSTGRNNLFAAFNVDD